MFKIHWSKPEEDRKRLTNDSRTSMTTHYTSQLLGYSNHIGNSIFFIFTIKQINLIRLFALIAEEPASQSWIQKNHQPKYTQHDNMCRFSPRPGRQATHVVCPRRSRLLLDESEIVLILWCGICRGSAERNSCVTCANASSHRSWRFASTLTLWPTWWWAPNVSEWRKWWIISNVRLRFMVSSGVKVIFVEYQTIEFVYKYTNSSRIIMTCNFLEKTNPMIQQKHIKQTSYRLTF